MTETILEEFKDRVEEFTLVPAGGGKFELFKDGQEIYSKKETGEFPDEREMVEALK